MRGVCVLCVRVFVLCVCGCVRACVVFACVKMCVRIHVNKLTTCACAQLIKERMDQIRRYEMLRENRELLGNITFSAATPPALRNGFTGEPSVMCMCEFLCTVTGLHVYVYIYMCVYVPSLQHYYVRNLDVLLAVLRTREAYPRCGSFTPF